MDQKKLYKTVETIASKKFSDEKEMLVTVLNQIIDNEEINVNGGRLWRLQPDVKKYSLLYQTGNVKRIDSNFSLLIENYPTFDKIAKERTILGNETDPELLKIGIFKYSASGVGDKVKVNGKIYYEYILALNSDNIDDDLRFNLNIIATAITSQIKQRRYSHRAKTLREDIDKARQLQKSILPEHEYAFHDYDLFGITDPAEIVGGDFFDYLEIGEDNDRLGVMIGDAASKGVSAAAEAMYVSGALRMACSFEIKVTSLMKRMNQLVNKIFADDKFASMFYGELSTNKTGLFLYANAGHNPPVFIRGESDEITLLDPTGPVLGPTPQSKFTVQNINFNPGDVLLIYSDGLTEAMDNDFNEFGEVRLIESLKQNKHLVPKEIAYNILNDVIKFSRNGKYTDDKTLVVIKRTRG